ncbi:SPW repeat protein [Streptomyces sp. H27-D2]|uniref:SPW repeat protein n=1 Tax=Streptomyces sp. H27-D2 TaxID=3046304 RepID=UPI002DBE275F|nr:SPW repeat protein [Streptomyces sp. H27-D2]MEC4015307.1 SPW repeat protein [Streptomyces sp. H27-D2]
MADVSHRPGDLAGHPDASEMRDRYARMLGKRGVVAVDGLLLLAGLYAAISPWTVHFSASSSELALNNLIMGIAVAVIGLALTAAPERMQGLSGACAAIGVWLIVAPWVVTRDPGTGMIWNNIIVGACICLLGLTAAGMVMRNNRET